jgi:Icc-related predicted phosphoesterase
VRIIAFTDIHGAYEKVVRVLGSEETFDAVILGGDLTTGGSAREARDAVRLMLDFQKPVLAVAGNMDPQPVEDELRALGISIDGCGRVIDGVGFFGVSAAPISPLNTPNEITEEEILLRAERGWSAVEGCRRTVFVPHAPPAGTLDRIRNGRHVGSTAVREFIERRKPDLVVCGHIHEARGIDHIGATTAVNCGPAGKGSYAVIDISEELRVTLREAADA